MSPRSIRPTLSPAPYCVGCATHHTRRCDEQRRINRAKTAFGLVCLLAADVLIGVAIGVQL
ncbi:hypothetical protein [Mycobacterium phage Y10]|uniref:Uncharacterized protein n=1 Tax=Mycobacterium phage Y10 TaxID=2072010 RepID=A0A2Z5XB83_9CAUD|nr:hypothetical protein PBI_JF1_51 [Mycobacterium phage JF1]BBC43338.1 hypothetical protein [Mycobacterium phage Y10]BBC43429.1 hypothetical protein [Mycobacterium phage Y2]BBC43520.1 hypothetical protein [Mycobacterium phage Y10]